jgi:hypothetical protein
MTAPDSDPVRLVQELALLETEYWYDVDHNWGRTAHELIWTTACSRSARPR